MNKPVVKLIAYQPNKTHQRLNHFNGQIKLSEDFDIWPEEEAEFLGIIDI
jgi:hypothetical protein